MRDIIEFIKNNSTVTFEKLKTIFSDVNVDDLKLVFESTKNSIMKFKDQVAEDPSEGLKDLVAAAGIATAGYAILSDLPRLATTAASSKGFTDINVAIGDLGQNWQEVWKNVKNPIKFLSNSIKESLNAYLQNETALHNKLNQSAGLTAKLSKEYRDNIFDATPEVARMGISFQELANYSSSLVENSGKFLLQNTESIIRSAEVAAAYVGTMTELSQMYPEFAKVGYGMTDTTEALAKAGKESVVLGLRAQSVTAKIGENIDKLNQYGFKNGVEGLTKMAQKSVEFRMNMESVFGLAEKTMDITDAINVSGELMALGGAVGDILDPFKMAYMAVNDVNGIQDALIQLTRGMAAYNDSTQKFEVSGVNLRLMREYARVTGTDLKTLMDTTIAAAERQQVHNDLMARGLDVTKEQEDFISNISQMRGGKMSIELQSEELRSLIANKDGIVAVEDLTQGQIELLQQYQDEFKQMTDKDIVREQATNIQNISRDISYITNLLSIRFGKTVSAMADKGLRDAMGVRTNREVKAESLERSKSTAQTITRTAQRAVQRVQKYDNRNLIDSVEKDIDRNKRIHEYNQGPKPQPNKEKESTVVVQPAEVKPQIVIQNNLNIDSVDPRSLREVSVALSKNR